MKQFRLLLTLFALTLGWTNVSAQTWMGNEVSEGTFYLYNVGAQKYLNNGDPNQGWGTNAYLQAGFGLDVTLAKISDGVYTIETGIKNNDTDHYLASTTWCDGGATYWTFRVVEGEANVYQIIYDGQYLMANEALNDVELVGDPGERASSTYWMLVSEDDFKTAMSAKAYSATDPMDVSVFIKGRSFARNDNRNNNWTLTCSGAINDRYRWIEGFNNKYYGCEFWNCTFDIHQDISGLPEGIYEVKCSGFSSTGAAFVYGNDQKGALTTDNAAANGSRATAYQLIADEDAWAGQSSGTFVVTDGNLTVGLKRDVANDWCVYDEFRLYYYGLDLTVFENMLADAVAAAQALNGTIPQAAYDALNAVVVENNNTYSTAADYNTATNNINAAISNAQALVGKYNRYKDVKAAVVEISSTINTTEADTQADAATNAEALDEAVTTLRAALLTYLPTAEASEEAPIDLTNALIDNPTVSENVDYWNVENVGRPYDWSSGPTTNYGETEFYQSTFDFNQTLTLAKGTYEFGVTGFHRAGNHATYFYAGEDKVLIPGVESSVVNDMAEAKTYFDNGNGKVSLKFALDNESNTLKIGIVNNDTETDRWTIFRNFTLKYYGSQVDLSSYVELLASTVTAANAVEGTVPSAVYQILAAVVTENNKTYTTKEAYLTAIATIEEAIATAKAMQDPYNRYKIVKAAVIAISETISTSEADAQAEAATTTEALDAAVVTLRTSLLSYLPTAVVAEGEFIDLTDAMVDNPSVRQNTSYWTIDGTPNGNYSWGKVSDEECEFYNQNFDFYQTLTLSKGTYEFGVTGFHRAGNHATYFYAGEDKVLIPGVESSVVNTMAAAKTYFDEGNGKVALKFALEGESNTLKIGIVNNDTETDKWTIFRDFTLKYYGSQVDLSSYEEAWNEAVAAAEAAIAANPNVTGEELTAVNAAKADVPEQTKESYITKTEALTNATAALIAAAPSYNLYAEKKALVDNFEALPYADPAKKPSTEGAEAPTNAEDAVTKANAFMPALRLYVESNALAEGVEGAVNLTSKIKQDAIADWTAEITGSNATFVLKNADGTDPDTYTAADGTNGRNLIDSGDLWGASSWTAKMTQSVKLTPGKYIITASARGSNNLTTFKLLADDKSVDMEHFGAAEGSGIFNHGFNDYYIEFELTEVKDVVIGFEAATEAAHNWCSVARFRLAQLEENAIYATDEDLTLLTESLQPTAKLGFDEGDFAPYNNVESLTAAEAEVSKVYAEMEAFDGKAMKSTVDAAIETINALEWTANTKEVNAVYDGTFASAENNGAPAGWTMSNNTLGGDYHSRAFVGDERMAEFNETNSGLFLRFDGTNSNRGSMYYYGNTTGYTMPLKANTNYYVKVDFAGWGSTGKPLRINITGPEGFTSVSMTENTSVRADNADETPQQFLVKFTTAEAGNYVINFQTPGSDDNKHNVVVSNLELFKEKALKGDVNGDTKVDVADVTALVNAIKDGEAPQEGKITDDDIVDAADVEALVNMILGIEE